MILLNGLIGDTVNVWDLQVRLEIMLGHGVPLSHISECVPHTWYAERLQVL